MIKQADWSEYLSGSNAWTKRLLGQVEFTKVRDLAQIEREYDQDKYGTLAQLDLPTVEAYKQKEFEQAGLSDQNDTYVSFGEAIFRMPLFMARSIYRSILEQAIAPYEPESICELGCGYGWNLAQLCPRYADVYGGEYSKNAVALAQRLGLAVQEFNYYDLDSYRLLRNQSLIFTSHSIEQLPSAECFIQALSHYRERISVVVHLEPTYLPERTSLVGILRNRYLELNDYNRDLLLLLRQQDEIEILRYQPDCMGLNPLNSTCLIVWRFK
jgi:SAM-dependent methyltransferase